MRATTALLLVGGLASTALGAATKMFSDENCETEIPGSKVVFNGFATGDAIIPPEAKAIKVDSSSDVWSAYQGKEGDGCFGKLFGSLKNEECVKLGPENGIVCTRLCSGGLGGGNCAPTEITDKDE
ncbi:hypothetical protein B0T24DRAFT_253336 [Lasiosphaeria ovina]|uniref:Uncharacterized protein n=1 Tax=Lasiosphaeria ovina TaxID=92902 RepID=A0AAE0KAL6_9PEZI|nr:hypothetical protein B0T24DRAFT_253336 [Lasiosphaeria ovina]